MRRSNKRRVEARMFDRIVEIFCDFDDFCTSVKAEWEATLLTDGKKSDRIHGPDCGVVDSEIMTILVLYHASRFKNFKTFYNGIVRVLLYSYFPGAPCYERFLTLTKRVWPLLVFFLASRTGRKTEIYYIDSTPLPVCHNKRIPKHKVFAGWAERGKTSMGWFFGFKLHLVFNHEREIVAIKLTPGNISDTTPVQGLTRDLVGKLFGDKGYIGKKLAEDLLSRGLALMTRVRKNMKSLPVSFLDKALLNGRNIAETIIGHIKEFSSLRLPKHRSVYNAFTHITAAVVAYQLNPLQPKPIRVSLPD
jgi:hypothetical protein